MDKLCCNFTIKRAITHTAILVKCTQLNTNKQRKNMCCNGKLRLNTIKNLNFLKFVIRKHWDQDNFFFNQTVDI